MHLLPDMPSDDNAERAVLGAMLLDASSCWHEASDIVQASDFYSPKHGLIWSAMATLEESGAGIDTVMVRSQLALAGLLDRAGGDAYLLSLTDTIPIVANTEQHALRIRDLSAARSALQAALALVAEAREGIDDLADFLDRAESALATACEHRSGKASSSTIDEAVNEVFKDIVARADAGDHVEGYRTGFTHVDYMIGGMVPTNLTICAGRPGTGKTAFAMGAAIGVARSSNLPVIVFSLEQPKKQLIQRALASEASIDLRRMSQARIVRGDWEALTRVAGELSELPIDIVDESRLSVLDVRRHIRKAKRKRGKLALAVIDYLQLLRAGQKCDNREQEICFISKTLKEIAKEEDVAVLALAQLNRGAESQGKDKRPNIAQLRESGQIEQDADTILLLYRDELHNAETEDKGIAEIIIGKQRSGPTGTVRMAYRREYTRFDNLEEHREPEQERYR